MSFYTVLGTCDNVNTCGRCGRDNLKRTVAIESDDFGVEYLGTECAAAVTKRGAGYITRKARAAKVTRCEECDACPEGTRYNGVLGRVLCHDCTDAHIAERFGVPAAELFASR